MALERYAARKRHRDGDLRRLPTINDLNVSARSSVGAGKNGKMSVLRWHTMALTTKRRSTEGDDERIDGHRSKWKWTKEDNEDKVVVFKNLQPACLAKVLDVFCRPRPGRANGQKGRRWI